MAHNRGYGFDARFTRLSFVLFVGICFLFFIKRADSAYIAKKSFFFSTLLLWTFYFFSVLWSKDMSCWEDNGIRNSLIQIIFTSFVIETTSDSVDDCKAYLKIYLFSIVYMMALLIIFTPYSDWGAERVGSALGLNSNTVGIRCSISFILSLYFFTCKEKFRIIYLFIAILSVYISLFSGSRKAVLILIVGFIVYWCGKVKGLKLLVRISLAIIAVSILIYFIMTNETLYHILGRRIERGFNFILGNSERIVDSSSIERKFYRDYAIEMFYNHPIIGYGGNGFVAEMKRINHFHIAYSHCNYFELLSTLGIIGFVLYYKIQINMLLASLKQYQFSSTDKETVCVVLAIILTNLLSEYYIVSYYNPSMQILLCVLFVTLRFLNKKEGYTD